MTIMKLMKPTFCIEKDMLGDGKDAYFVHSSINYISAARFTSEFLLKWDNWIWLYNDCLCHCWSFPTLSEAKNIKLFFSSPFCKTKSWTGKISSQKRRTYVWRLKKVFLKLLLSFRIKVCRIEENRVVINHHLSSDKSPNVSTEVWSEIIKHEFGHNGWKSIFQ